ncbi:MAG: hypothetical protein HQ483_09940 [Rhodospirillales bacterium]|nr:hypothetical protein [Rhodospirillales bacterium]
MGWGIRHAFINLGLLFRSAWLYMLLFGALYISTLIVVVFLDHARHFTYTPATIGLFSLLVLFVLSCFCVSWHRVILLNELRPATGPLQAPDIKYFALVGGIYLLNLIPAIVDTSLFTALIEDSSELPHQQLFILVLPHLTAFFLFGCACMIMPAIAVEDDGMTWRMAWRLWSGNRVRYFLLLCCGAVSLALIILAIVTIADFIVEQEIALPGMNLNALVIAGIHVPGWVAAWGLLTPLVILVAFFYVAAGVGALSAAYARIVRRAIVVDGDYRPQPELRDQCQFDDLRDL